jgi:hypothetical protein
MRPKTIKHGDNQMDEINRTIAALKEMCRKLVNGERIIEQASMQDYINWYNSQEIKVEQEKAKFI